MQGWRRLVGLSYSLTVAFQLCVCVCVCVCVQVDCYIGDSDSYIIYLLCI